MNRKGDAGGAAVLIFVFTILLVIYILFIPEATRQELLGIDKIDKDNGVIPSIEKKNILLEENPRQLTPEGRDDFEYAMPSFTLFQTTEAQVLKTENPFIIKNGWFTKKSKTINFQVENKDLISGVLLSFNAPVREGILLVSLNDDVIFENQIRTLSAQPVILPKEKLKQGENTVLLSASSVGIRFWSVNEYQFENIRILGDITDISRQQSENLFFVPESRQNVEIASLKFVPECDERDVGVLNVLVNNQRLFSGVPECRLLNTVTLPPSFLREGVNTVTFSTTKGTYLVDRIIVRTKLKNKFFPTYYFVIDNEEWEDIRKKDKIANLSMRFLLPDNRINLKIEINDDRIGVFQTETEFSEIVDSFLQEGNNVIRLVPEDTVDVIELKLAIEDIN